jgi:hypothetical protein
LYARARGPLLAAPWRRAAERRTIASNARTLVGVSLDRVLRLCLLAPEAVTVDQEHGRDAAEQGLRARA